MHRCGIGECGEKEEEKAALATTPSWTLKGTSCRNTCDRRLKTYCKVKKVYMSSHMPPFQGPGWTVQFNKTDQILTYYNKQQSYLKS